MRLFAWAQSADAPSNPSSPSSKVPFHSNGQGIFPTFPKHATSDQYATWASGGKGAGETFEEPNVEESVIE